MAVSLHPSTYAKFEGYFTEGIVTFANPRFEIYEFKKADGTVVNTQVALVVDHEHHDKEIEIVWPVGKPEDFTPSDDKMSFNAIGSKTAISESCALALFMKSLIDAGFPSNAVTDNISFLKGIVLDLQTIEIPNYKAKEGKRIPTFAKVRKIVAMPGQAAPNTNNTATNNGAAPNTNVASNPESKAQKAIHDVLAAKGGFFDMNQALSEVFSAIQADPDKVQIMQVMTQPGWFEKPEHPWTKVGNNLVKK